MTDKELLPSMGFKLISLGYRPLRWNYLFLKQVAHIHLGKELVI